ncbi:REST corepressor 1-like [Babylonia areolata]|uniref:REST corepressor 1-like n=1 Tax=Babylonia areolata TaxID=304850 RepID=UPI003FD1EB06
MVMADKNPLTSRNGKRSRGPSPNSSEYSDSSEDPEKKSRVGEEYQAEIPSYDPTERNDSGGEAMLVWAPAKDLSDAKVDEYISVAKEKHGYNTEQALGMLFWHKHNVDRALADLANFTPFPDEWTVEDKVLFEQAFTFHGKQFHRIRQMLPDKSMTSLVKYFYSWKRMRTRTSQMDRQAKKGVGQAHSNGQEEDMASDASSNHSEQDMKEEEEACANCGLRTTELHMTRKGSQCPACYQHWRRTGELRSAGPRRQEAGQSRHNPMKHKRRPPKGMCLDSSDLHTMVTTSPSQAHTILKSLDSDIVSLKRQVQNNKQMLSLQKHKLGTGVEDFRPAELPHKINSRWTNEDLLLAVQGVRQYGKDFKAIAEMIGNKMEVHVRSFFANFRRRYNLDEVLAEYEAERGLRVAAQQGETIPGAVPPLSSTTITTLPAALPLTCPEVKDTGEGITEASAVCRPGFPINGNTPHILPPPLLPQPAPLLAGSATTPAPPPATTITAATNSRVAVPLKTVLQQPPPLIRPPANLPPHTAPNPTLH